MRTHPFAMNPILAAALLASCPAIRASTSVAEPGPKGMTKRMGRDGYACAETLDAT